MAQYPNIRQVLAAYGFSEGTSAIPHGTGLINRTWLVRSGKGDYILQQLNSQVFDRPAPSRARHSLKLVITAIIGFSRLSATPSLSTSQCPFRETGKRHLRHRPRYRDAWLFHQ